MKAKGLAGDYYVYKPSTRKPGCVLKSRMTISAENDGEYFHIDEIQRSPAYRESDNQPVEEHSQGFGFVKTGNIWMLMKEVDREQPRIFCFDRLTPSDTSRVTRKSGYKQLRGFVLEKRWCTSSADCEMTPTSSYYAIARVLSAVGPLNKFEWIRSVDDPAASRTRSAMMPR